MTVTEEISFIVSMIKVDKIDVLEIKGQGCVCTYALHKSQQSIYENIQSPLYYAVFTFSSPKEICFLVSG